jgi:CrcB protein
VAWGTVVVNVVGAFGLGLVHDVGPPVLTVAGVAGLGALTTFSSFARDVVALADARKAAACAAYVGLSLTAGIGAAALGMAITS